MPAISDDTGEITDEIKSMLWNTLEQRYQYCDIDFWCKKNYNFSNFRAYQSFLKVGNWCISLYVKSILNTGLNYAIINADR